MKKNLLFIISVFLFYTLNCFGQNKKIDSLHLCLKPDKEDTSRVNTLNLLAREYINKSDYFIADSIAKRALTLAEKLNFKIGEANSLGYIGVILFYKGEYEKSIKYSIKALKIDEEIKNKIGIANRLGKIANVYYIQGDYPIALDYNFKAKKIVEGLEGRKGVEIYLCNIGLIYMKLGDYTKALDYYFKSLEIVEKLNDKRQIGVRLSNIAIIYNEQGDYLKSLDYSLKALKIAEEAGDKLSIALMMGNMGTVYTNQGDYSKALIYHSEALKISKNIGDKNGISRHLRNIANVYENNGNYSKALDYYSNAFEISKEIDDREGISAYLINISELFLKLNKYKEAYNAAYRAISISDSMGIMINVKLCYENLSDLYKESNILLPDTIGGEILNFEQMRLRSFYYYKRSIAIRDTLFNQENKKELVRKEMNYEFDKKEAITKADNEKQQAIVKEKSRKQKWVLVLVSCVLILVFVFAGFIFRALRITRKQKKIIEIKNKETEEQKKVIEEQKKIVEEKNKDITDSINYAKRIQHAMLPHRRDIWNVFPQSFVLFKPKDIVSGDFYFFHKNDQSAFIAVADCTGHGVPGALMSMIGAGKLNDAVSESSDPSEILAILNKGIKTALKQSDSTESTRDGMDVALCAVDVENRIVKYAGANRPIWIVRKGQIEVEEIKATKKAIGGLTEDHQHFDSHELKLQQGDTFYICTDGYADQFGKLTGKKLMTKTLKEVIIEIQNKSMKEQEQHLDHFVENWKAGTEQVDDILIIGIRV